MTINLINKKPKPLGEVTKRPKLCEGKGASYIGAGKGLFSSSEEVDRFIQSERRSWEEK